MVIVIIDTMMLFSVETGLEHAGILDRSADSGCWVHLQKQETKRNDEGSSVASPMPKSVLFNGREDKLLRE